MKKYIVRIRVVVLADDIKDAIVEARNNIYNSAKNDEFDVFDIS